MNEKDAKVIHNLFAEFHYVDDLGVIKSKLVDYVATTRKEAREVAFKQIRERVEAVNPQLTLGSANGSMMKKCILAEIEAAANTEEGAGDGQTTTNQC